MTRIVLSIVLLMASSLHTFAAKEFFEPKTRKEIPYKLLEIEVQRGDTLHAFAERYLDDPSKWPQLLKYNKIPSGDPDLIIPGERLKVPIGMVKDEIADIFYIKNNVRARRKESNEWETAQMYQRLYPEDGIRTADNSYSKIKYLKGGRASIGENSLVFLRPEKKRDDVIRLQVGELTAKDVKVLTATAAIDPEKGSEFKATVDEAQTTKLSVLKGKVDFFSSGEIVTVVEGFMSMAELNAPPSEPIKLPDPPKFKKLEGLREYEHDEEEELRKNVIETGVLDVNYMIEQLNMEEDAVEEEEEEERRTYRDRKKPAPKNLDLIKEVHVQVAQDKDFSRIAVDRIINAQTPEMWREELEDGIYWWRAAFINMHGVEGRFSEPVELEIDRQLQQIEIISPKDGEKIEKEIVTIRGKTEKDIILTVNDERIVLEEDGSFLAATAVEPGRNRILIKATDFQNRTVIKEISVYGTYEAGSRRTKSYKNPPPIDIFSPKDGLKSKKKIIVIRGKTRKNAGLFVGDGRVAVEEDGSFVTAVTIKSGENKIQLRAVDLKNRETVKELNIVGLFKDTGAGGGTGEPPIIEIDTPREGEKFKKRTVIIRGRTKTGVSLTVNNERVVVEEDGSFIAATRIRSGENKLTVKGVDFQNLETVKEITVIGLFEDFEAEKESEAPPPIELFTPSDKEEISKSILVIRGKTNSGVSVTVNDTRAMVEEDGTFITAINLNEGENKILIEATDFRERKTTKEITVYGKF